MINRGALLVIELFLCTLCRPVHNLVLIRRFTGKCVSSFLAKTRRNARILILPVYSISTPVEITAAVILLTFWDSNVSALPPELYFSTQHSHIYSFRHITKEFIQLLSVSWYVASTFSVSGEPGYFYSSPTAF